VVQVPPLTVSDTHAPLPLQTRFVPQLVPGGALLALQTGAPVAQLVVPGLQVGPHGADTVHALQVPVESQTMFVPQLAPAAFNF
jgi:hypothetical protein